MFDRRSRQTVELETGICLFYSSIPRQFLHLIKALCAEGNGGKMLMDT